MVRARIHQHPTQASRIPHIRDLDEAKLALSFFTAAKADRYREISDRTHGWVFKFIHTSRTENIRRR